MIPTAASPSSTIPMRSSRVPGVAAPRGSTLTAAAKAAIPTGTLIRNTIRQPVPSRSASIRTPARIGATIAERPMTGPKVANTLLISSSGKTSLIRPNPWGITSAPKPPCNALRPIRISGEGASAHAADIAVNPAEPIRKRRRRPKMSPSLAAVTSSTANGGVWAPPSHCSVDAPPPRSWRIVGPATLTIVASMRSITSAARAHARTIDRAVESRVAADAAVAPADGTERMSGEVAVALMPVLSCAGRAIAVGLRTLFVTNIVRYEHCTTRTAFVSRSRISAMDAPVRPRSTRDRPSKAPLSEEVILDAALRILREEGLEAVTMRRLAAELDTGPASLYVYISGRRELQEALLDRVAGMIELEEPDPPRWREQVHCLFKRILTSMEEHPGIAEVAVGNPPMGDRSLHVADNLVALLRAGRVTPQDAAWAVDIMMLITTAAAVERDIYQRHDVDKADFHDRMHAVFASLSPARYPHLAALSEEMVNGDGDDRFNFAIDTFLDGLVARAARTAAHD